MALTRKQFDTLYAIYRADEEVLTQRKLSKVTEHGLGTINTAVRELEAAGLISGSRITAAGLEALQPYKVDNAILMAAGFSSRFIPLSYERPKGLLEVRDEILIERQIRQLKEAGIDDITVVVGYMKEALFYLADKFGVNIVVNEEYATRNNHSTLMKVKDLLRNTYVCSSDNYFTENLFEEYVYSSYYAVQYSEGETQEWCVETGPGNRITSVTVGGRDSLYMRGHVYFDRSFSKKFVEILEAEYDLPETAPKLWESLYIEHLPELSMVAREYYSAVIQEFDSMDELVEFDNDFATNVDSTILDNICTVLGCKRSDVHDFVRLKDGHTNLSFSFVVESGPAAGKYVYRHPRDGADHIVNRASEAYSEAVAKDLKIDKTFIFEDPEHGWKISRYVEKAEPFDYQDSVQVQEALSLVRRLHESGRESEWSLDLYAKALEIKKLLKKKAYPFFPEFDELSEIVTRLNKYVSADGVESVLCHNNFYGENILVTSEGMDLIDWEYSAMSDYASDLGTFISCSEISVDEALEVLEAYFGRKLTLEEKRHCFAYVALSAYYWFLWGIYKETSENPVGKWLYRWHRCINEYGKLALGLYEE